MTKSFDESKHPRDKDGKFTKGVGTKAEQEKLKQMGIIAKEKIETSNLTNEEKRLQELTGEKVENVKQKQMKERNKKRHERNKKRAEKRRVKQQEKANKLLNAPLLQFDIGKKVLHIKFNNDTIGKNLVDKFNSDWIGFNWKQRNLDKFPDVLKGLKYDRHKPEKGKQDGIHTATKEWHYLVGEYMDGDKTFNVVANIADNGEEQFLYELSMKKKKEPTE